MKKILADFLMSIFVLCLIAGCATTHSDKVIEDKGTTSEKTLPAAKKTIFISSVVDSRKFQKKSDDRSVQVLDTSKEDKTKVIGLKRNNLGMVIGTLYLEDNKTVEQFTREAVSRTLKQNGYTLIENKGKIKEDTVIADIQITKFWTWHTPGIWDIDIKSEIEHIVTLKRNGKQDKLRVNGLGTTKKSIGTYEAYQQSIRAAHENLLKNLKKKLK